MVEKKQEQSVMHLDIKLNEEITEEEKRKTPELAKEAAVHDSDEGSGQNEEDLVYQN